MSFRPFIHPRRISESPLFPAYDTDTIEDAMGYCMANWQNRIKVLADFPRDIEDIIDLLDRQEAVQHIPDSEIEEAVRYAANNGNAACILIATCLRDRLNRALVTDRTEEECNIIYDHISSEEYEYYEEATYEIESALTLHEVSIQDAVSALIEIESNVSRIESQVAEVLKRDVQSSY